MGRIPVDRTQSSARRAPAVAHRSARSAASRLAATTRRTTLIAAALVGLSIPAFAQDQPERTPRIAAIVTEYRHNSHADVLVSRLLQGDALDGKGEFPKLKLVSLYTDQVPANDTSRRLAKEHGFRLSPTVDDALTLGGKELAVDGVMLVCEHGKYPESDLGQTMFPKRRLFGDMVKVFEKTGKSVPVFYDKHLSHTWDEALYAYETSKKMAFPILAGSSLPLTWREPAIDVNKGAKLKEIVALSFHTLDAYGFHALEVVQCLAERRAGGETGVKSVQCLTGAAVWDAGQRGVYDGELFKAAFGRLKDVRIPPGAKLEDKGVVPDPVLWTIDYEDGLRANVLTLNYAVNEWSAAWRTADDGAVHAALFATQEFRPFMHFGIQTRWFEKMVHTGKPAWPVERTLMTSGLLDALLISKKRGGVVLPTPWLKRSYQTDWEWKQPPPPPPNRPIEGQ